MKVLRNKQEKTLNVTVDELDLDAEQNAARRRRRNNDQPSRRKSTAPAGSG